MEEDYSEYWLQPGDIPLGKTPAIIGGMKMASIVFLIFSYLIFGLAFEDLFIQFFLSGCGLLILIAILWGSLNGIMVTDVHGNNIVRGKYSENVKKSYENNYEWDDELFNEIMAQFGAVFGVLNLQQFTELYKDDDVDEDDDHFYIEIEALFKAIDTDNNDLISLADIKQGCSMGYEHAYPHQFHIALGEKMKQQIMAEFKASKSN